jgi:5-oxoprolinase (ATP-hydrolysing)
MAGKLKQLEGKKLRAEERLDDGSLLKVSVTVRAGIMGIDFSGSAGVHPGNLNATPAIVQSVVLYVLRLLVNRPVPLNEGLMQQVRVILPPGLLNPVFGAEHESPAVVGGNTEVSQRLTDTLLKAFGVAACSQGTMNNFLFGNERFGYYETICGGTGAGPGFNGTDAVHQHMTNTRITDAEIFEHRYPVRLVRFAIRKNSGGTGRWKGGNGVEREFLFNAALEVSVHSQHRTVPPYGLKGGKSGKTGSQYLVRPNGVRKALKGIDSVSVRPGDRLVILTPGGGGYGRA